jgi:hypothetical protein
MEKQGSYRRLVFSNAVILVATLLACETYGNYVFGVRINSFETIHVFKTNLMNALNAGEIRMLSSKKAQDLIFHAAETDITQDLDHTPVFCQIDSNDSMHRSKFCEEQSSLSWNEGSGFRDT